MKNEKAEKIKILIVDADGVLTDGTIICGNFNDEYRAFNVHDGFGFELLHRSGIKSAIISGKLSRALARRARSLKIKHVYQNVSNKSSVFKKILKKCRLKPEEAAYVGDDLFDLPVLKNAGFSATVPEACGDVKNAVDYVSKKRGGRGAVREIIEFILKSQDKWEKIIQHYLG
ncbi:MAG: HAD-IIIA family hydrolase [Candidatus Omnitrophica bacterium]|nr:HAD-IIIA family hydrolase [Candidatus Omnitrophota bacterium]MBU1925861.1 HAD-IIIA family hydrolase [Candidatus Omnitrophota bacterium]